MILIEGRGADEEPDAMSGFTAAGVLFTRIAEKCKSLGHAPTKEACAEVEEWLMEASGLFSDARWQLGLYALPSEIGT